MRAERRGATGLAVNLAYNPNEMVYREERLMRQAVR